MTYRLIASLDTKTGELRRWRRGARGRAEKLGQDRFTDWPAIRNLEEQVYDLIQAFRSAWAPSDDPTPSAPPTVRIARAA